MNQFRECCWVAFSNPIYCYHSDIYARLMTQIVERGVVDCHIHNTCGAGNGDNVPQDGYPLQSEGRTPGDEDSGGVDDSYIEVTNRI